MTDDGKRRGPKTRPEAQARKHNLTFRARGDIRDLLEQISSASGRSISEEIEKRLERSFELEGMREIIREEIDKSAFARCAPPVSGGLLEITSKLGSPPLFKRVTPELDIT